MNGVGGVVGVDRKRRQRRCRVMVGAPRRKGGSRRTRLSSWTCLEGRSGSGGDEEAGTGGWGSPTATNFDSGGVASQRRRQHGLAPAVLGCPSVKVHAVSARQNYTGISSFHKGEGSWWAITHALVTKTGLTIVIGGYFWLSVNGATPGK